MKRKVAAKSCEKGKDQVIFVEYVRRIGRSDERFLMGVNETPESV